LLSFSLFSCEKDEDRIVAKPGTAATLTASQSSLVLTEVDKNKDAVTFTWQKSNFGYDAAVKYALEFGKKGENFAKAKTINLDNTLVKTYKVGELNAIATELGLPGFTATEMEVRIKAQISDQYTPAYSNVISITTTPFLSEPEYPTVYLVGDATDNGWDNTKASAMFRDETDPFVYTYTGYFKTGPFKMLGYQGKWAPQWGTSSTGALAFREKDSDPDPGSFTIPAAGYYTVKLDLRNNVVTIDPYDAAGAETFASVGIIGPFTNWANVVPMTKTATNPHIWAIDQTFTEDTEMKFRIAEGWSVNWGANADETKARVYDKGRRDGPNIVVKAGKYKIYFNDLTGYYVLVKQQ
jgi:hypothetical protein